MSLTAPHILSNRYWIAERIGEGGMGSVYRALDRLTDKDVAIKRVLEGPAHFNEATNSALLPTRSALSTTRLLDESGSNLRYALAQEFQILASLRHPHIISVVDYGFDAQQHPYFTMDLLPAPETILVASRDKSPLAKVRYLTQMLQALEYLHNRGVIHCDLKPGNVLVQDDQVKVLDFGLAVLADQAKRTTAGTLAYLAPEILSGQAANRASDLYAVGVIAYELFTGRHPFSLVDITTFFEEVINKAPDLDGIQPASYAATIGRLLAKDPAARYASAREAMNAFHVTHTSYAAGQPLPVEDANIRDSFLQAAPLIGRERELEQLVGALASASEGHGSAWLIGGESGVGKSRLFAELATRAVVRGVLVLRGGAMQDGATGFQPWIEPLRRLLLAAEVSDAEAAILKTIIPDAGRLLRRKLPDAPAMDDPKSGQVRLLATVAAIFHRMAQPVLLILDDLQWAGEESLALFRQLNPANRPLLLIGGFRDDERADLPESLKGARHIRLERLDGNQIADLSAAMLGEHGRQPELVAYLERETEGNVFFLVEVMRLLAENAGQLARIDASTLPESGMAGGIRQIVARRLARVPAGALPLLHMAAVLGRELDTDLLNIALDDWQMWLTPCADAAILEIRNERWQFTHDKLREGVLAALDTNESRMLHEAAAHAIEQVYPDAPDRAAALVRHWHVAGDTSKEYHYARLAGERARQVGSGIDAVKFFRRALALAPNSGEAARVTARLGQALFWIGDFAEADAYCLQALEMARAADDTWLIAEALGKLGNTAILRGEYARGREYHTQSLAIARALGDGTLISHALSGLSDAAWRTGDSQQAMRYLQENLAAMQRLSDPVQKCHTWNMLGIVHAVQAQYVEATEAFGNALTIAREMADKIRLAQVISNLGEVALVQGDHARAVRLLAEAMSYSEETGNAYSVANISASLGLIAVAQGRLENAASAFKKTLDVGRRTDSVMLCLMALFGYGRISAQSGDLRQALHLFGFVSNHPAISPDLSHLVDDALAALRASLPPDEFNAAFDSGKVLSIDAALDLILFNSNNVTL